MYEPLPIFKKQVGMGLWTERARSRKREGGGGGEQEGGMEEVHEDHLTLSRPPL